MSAACPRAAGRGPASDLVGDLGRIRDATWGLCLAGDLSQAQDSVRDLAGIRAAARLQRSFSQVPPWAAGLMAAARLLPAADRARYLEEYQAELWVLAWSGAGRLRRLRYALRQLLRILPLGIALRSPRRRSAAR
jgi:hypothetical protein